MKQWLSQIRIFLILTLLTGVLYPLLIVLVGRIFFPAQANGSLLVSENRIVGSRLLGQEFVSPLFVHGRPSECYYATQPSSGFNWGPFSLVLRDSLAMRTKRWLKENGGSLALVPPEMVSASGSGFDPHISAQAAFGQEERIASACHWTQEQRRNFRRLVETSTSRYPGCQYPSGIVNVLELNLKLQQM